MKRTKVYDYSGTLVNNEKFEEYFKKTDPELYHKYRILGKKDVNIKKANFEKAKQLFIHASDNNLFEVYLNPNVEERLYKDISEGYEVSIFSNTPIETIEEVIQDLGIDKFIRNENIINVQELAEKLKKPELQKEDEKLWPLLQKYLLEKGYDNLHSLTDDSVERVQKLVKASELFNIKPIFDSVYNLDTKAKSPEEQAKDYKIINNILLAV